MIAPEGLDAMIFGPYLWPTEKYMNFFQIVLDVILPDNIVKETGYASREQIGETEFAEVLELDFNNIAKDKNGLRILVQKHPKLVHVFWHRFFNSRTNKDLVGYYPDSGREDFWLIKDFLQFSDIERRIFSKQAKYCTEYEYNRLIEFMRRFGNAIPKYPLCKDREQLSCMERFLGILLELSNFHLFTLDDFAQSEVTKRFDKKTTERALEILQDVSELEATSELGFDFVIDNRRYRETLDNWLECVQRLEETVQQQCDRRLEFIGRLERDDISPQDIKSRFEDLKNLVVTSRCDQVGGRMELLFNINNFERKLAADLYPEQGHANIVSKLNERRYSLEYRACDNLEQVLDNNLFIKVVVRSMEMLKFEISHQSAIQSKVEISGSKQGMGNYVLIFARDIENYELLQTCVNCNCKVIVFSDQNTLLRSGVLAGKGQSGRTDMYS